MHHHTDRIAHTTAFVTPVVERWLEREIAQWVHPMKDRSDDPSHHERTLLPRSYISLPWSAVFGVDAAVPDVFSGGGGLCSLLPVTFGRCRAAGGERSPFVHSEHGHSSWETKRRPPTRV